MCLIRYSTLGVGYDENGPLVTGVATNKNSLGLIVFVIMLGVLWNIRALLTDKKTPNRTRHLVAQVTLFLFGVLLLKMAHCATAIACIFLGACLMLVTSLRFIRKTPGRVHALCMAIIVVGGITLMFGGESVVTGALGRRSDLGRSDIWKAAIASADSPIFGTGFESFWNVNVEKVAAQLRDYWGPTAHNLVSAHNGLYRSLFGSGVDRRLPDRGDFRKRLSPRHPVLPAQSGGWQPVARLHCDLRLLQHH